LLLKRFHAALYLLLNTGKVGQDLVRTSVVHFFVDGLLIAINAKVVALGDNVGLRHCEALRGSRAVELGRGSLLPAQEHVGQIVLHVLVGKKGRRRSELVFGKKRRPLVVEGKAVGLHVIEPDVVRATGVGLGEEQDGGRDAGVGFEDTAR